MHAEDVEPWRKRREKLIRLGYSCAGALLTAALALGVNVFGGRINRNINNSPVPLQNCTRNSQEFEGSDQRQLEVLVSVADQNCWKPSLDNIPPGQAFDVAILYKNLSDSETDNVTIDSHLPSGFDISPANTLLGNARYPKGVRQEGVAASAVVNGGVNIGSYLVGANAWMIFRVYDSAWSKRTCQFSIYPISARITQPADISGWVSAGLVTPKRC